MAEPTISGDLTVGGGGGGVGWGGGADGLRGGGGGEGCRRWCTLLTLLTLE